MRRKLLKSVGRAVSVLALCSCVISEIQAQTHYSSNVAVGVRGGAETSYVFFSPSVPQSWPFGGTAGVMVRYIEENHFGLIAEVNWTQRGWSEDFEDAPYRYRRTLNYIEVPVLAHIYFGRRGRFFINAGPEVSFLLSESTSANFNPEDMASLPDFPIKNRTNEQMNIAVSNRVDYGITAGLGGEFSINRRNAISLEARVYYGIGNIMPSKRADVFSVSNQLSISLTAGYWFRVK